MASALPSRRDGRADGVARPADALPGLRHLGSPLAIDLWIADLDAAVDDASIALDETESARAARFVFDRDRRRYLAAHRLLRGLLASRTGISAGALSIAADPNGKPHLVDHPCAFNLSHSGDVVLIGTADDGEVGVDVEVLRPTLDLDVVVRSHFSAGERWTIESLAPGGRLVTCGNTTGYDVKLDLRFLFSKQWSLLGSFMGPLGELHQVLKFVFRKEIKPVIDKVYPLSEIRAAHEHLENKEQFGKVIVVP